jgi:hypothetical protein
LVAGGLAWGFYEGCSAYERYKITNALERISLPVGATNSGGRILFFVEISG